MPYLGSTREGLETDLGLLEEHDAVIHLACSHVNSE